MKKGKVLLIINIVFLFGFLLFSCFYNKSFYISSELISFDSSKEFTNGKSELNENIKLFYDNVQIPYDNVNNYYLLYSLSIDIDKIYMDHNFESKLLYLDDKKATILVYNNSYYKISDIYFTSIPTIQIISEQDKNKFIINSDSPFELYCEYHIRGNLSWHSIKKSYKFSLLSIKGKKVNSSLLNFKSNSSYILNPLFYDSTYMREKIAYDMWNNLSDEFNHDMKYVELFIDNKYQGIYGLKEEVNLKTFNADKNNDSLISIKDWNTNVNRTIFFDDYVIKDGLIDEFQFEEGVEDIELLRSLVNEEVIYDINNSANYWLFLNLTMAVDNTYKNEKILFKDINDKYVIYKVPWDLDWSLGNEKIYSVYENDKLDLIYEDILLSNKVRNDDNFINLLKEKYIIFKEKYYNYYNLSFIIDNYVDLLVKSGVIEREYNLYHNDYLIEDDVIFNIKKDVGYVQMDFYDSISNLKNFLKSRIEILDNYFLGEDYGI